MENDVIKAISLELSKLHSQLSEVRTNESNEKNQEGIADNETTEQRKFLQERITKLEDYLMEANY